MPTPRSGRRSRLFIASVLGLAAVLAGLVFLLRSRRDAPANLLLVTIDTLRADHLGCYGYGGASTPVLDALARDGARFENVQSAVPITGPSHATILTGLYPPAHGVRDNVTFPLDPRHATLASLLRARGYRTAAFIGAYPVASAFGFGQGFDEFNEGLHESPDFGQGAERPGNEVADAVVGWLANPGEGPFFVWMHLYDPHTPYAPPPPYDQIFRDRPYDGEVAFADAQVGRVLQAFRASGREKDTLVVVVADHGEALGEHDEAGHAVLIYQSTLRVPLILAGPGIPAGRVVPDQVGTVDLLPTVLGLLGFEPPQGLPGRSLRPALRAQRLAPQPLYSESLFGRLNCRWSTLRGWTGDGWKLIDGSAPELYELAGDPAEARNRAAEETQRVSRMREALAAAVHRMAPSGDRARAVALSPEQEERLRSLGYAGGSGGAVNLDEPGLPDPRTHVQLFERLQVAMVARGPAIRQALDEAEAILARDPQNPFAHFTLASLAYRSGRLEMAGRAFARTLEIDADRPGIRHYYGRLLREMGRLEDSERQLRMAVEQTTPDDARTRVNLAETLIALGKLDEAGALIQAALAKEPLHTEAQGSMGRLLVARGQPREAVAHLEKAAKGREAEPWIELAGVYIMLGEGGPARQAAGEALARSPRHPWALAVEGHALVLEGRRGEGLAVLRRALNLRPRRPDVWMTLARAFEAAGDATTAAHCRREASVQTRGN
jgi:arylsulfatase A-like enzyme/Tfp pilus assembly protein PilF